MARDVTLRATWTDYVGDETYELWLKHETDAWAIEQTGDLDPDDNDQQLIVLLTLVEGDDYVAQVRLKREGRYRTGYLTGNPDTWPGASRIEFTPGALIGAGAPVVNSATWSRTSSTDTQIEVSIDADDLDIDLKVFRDGVEVGTIAAPHVNPVIFEDINPPLAVDHDYTAKHTAGFLDGPVSNTVTVFAGPAVPTDFVQTSATDHYGSYTTTWDGDGATVRFQDDFACTDIFVTQTTTMAGTYVRHVEDTEIPVGDTQPVAFHARIRREVDAFSQTDVSDWVTILIQCLIEADNTEFNSCP